MLLVRASHSLPAAAAQLRAQNIAFTPFQIATTTPQSVTLPASGHLIITSSAAAASIPTSGHYLIHCVHQTTADTICAAIQHTAHTLATIGTNNAQALAETIIANHTPPQLFHHLTTQTANTGWYKTLTQVGHAIQRHHAYTTTYTQELTPEATTALTNNAPILLCSQKAAEHLLFLANRANISLMNNTVHALSPAIASIMQGKAAHIKTAATPTFTSLLKTLKK